MLYRAYKLVSSRHIFTLSCRLTDVVFNVFFSHSADVSQLYASSREARANLARGAQLLKLSPKVFRDGGEKNRSKPLDFFLIFFRCVPTALAQMRPFLIASDPVPNIPTAYTRRNTHAYHNFHWKIPMILYKRNTPRDYIIIIIIIGEVWPLAVQLYIYI